MLFFVRFLVVLGSHVGAFLEAKSDQNACFFGMFFRVVFLFVLGSFWGAILEAKSGQNETYVGAACVCDFVGFGAFLGCWFASFLV